MTTNITLEEIKQYRQLELETARLLNMLAELPRPAEADPAVAAAWEELRERLRAQLRENELKITRLHTFIAGCPDPLVRNILYCRFVEGLSWTAVAHRIGGTTGDSCRMMVKRYIGAAGE